jgi:hypothetical protein
MDARVQGLKDELRVTRPKILFTVKLQRVLALSFETRESIGSIGAMWLSDDQTFIAHTKILSGYLSVRHNSITHDFRDHQIITVNPPVDLTAFLSAVPDSRNWRCHRHRSGRFTRQTTAEEAAGLDRELCVAFPLDKQAVPKFFKAARRHWRALVGKVREVSLDVLVQQIMPGESKRDEQLRTNCRHLLASGDVNVLTQMVPFDAFANVFYRYGSPNGIAAQISELTPDDSTLNGSHPCFYDGIWVGIDRLTCLKEWHNARADMWAMVEGPNVGTFELLTKQRQRDGGVDRRWLITIDPLTEFGRWKISTNTGEIHPVNDFEQVLSYFELHPDAGLKLPERQLFFHKPWVMQRRDEMNHDLDQSDSDVDHLDSDLDQSNSDVDQSNSDVDQLDSDVDQSNSDLR